MNPFNFEEKKRVLVIGAGAAGSSIGRFCADSGIEVDLYEKSSYVSGHCYDEYDEHGILVHKFGPHYFRTNDVDLLRWLSRFTEWIPGRYYVRANINGQLIAMPISLSSIADWKGKAFSSDDFKRYLEKERVDIPSPQNAEEQCLSLVGKELYETFFKGYTLKQWGIHPCKLPASVTARLPLRFNHDERYPTEEYQVMPKAGYTKMFQKMLEHPNIHLNLNASMDSQELWSVAQNYDATFYTGPVDALFKYEFGELAYRSLRFEWRHFKQSYVQPCVQINYPNDFEYTRSVEAKHVTGQLADGTTLCYEYPQEKGPPFYPLLTQDNREMYSQYEDLVREKANPNNIFLVGRLAEFRYFNMDQVFLRALNLTKEILATWN